GVAPGHALLPLAGGARRVPRSFHQLRHWSASPFPVEGRELAPKPRRAPGRDDLILADVDDPAALRPLHVEDQERLVAVVRIGDENTADDAGLAHTRKVRIVAV